MEAPQDLSRLLTASEVCARFGSIGRHRLYQLVRRGQIPVVRIGRRGYRFPLSGLVAWLNAGGTATGTDQ